MSALIPALIELLMKRMRGGGGSGGGAPGGGGEPGDKDARYWHRQGLDADDSMQLGRTKDNPNTKYLGTDVPSYRGGGKGK